MRLLGLFLVLAMTGVHAQDAAKKKKRPATKQTEIKAHQKPTPEQIRRFNELQKKKQ